MTAAQQPRGRSASQCVQNPDASQDVGPDEYGEDYDTYADTVGFPQLVPQPPDGGWGWVVVAASFVANGILDGICYTFGVFLEAYADAFDTGQAATSVAGSLLTGVYLISGPFVGGLVNRFGSRRVMFVGSVLCSLSFFVSVWSPQLIHFILIYGFFGGLGFGLIFLPAIVHVNFFFERKRALATGIAVAGSGFGTIVMAPFATFLLAEYGWSGSHWILAGLVLNCAICGALMKPLEVSNRRFIVPQEEQIPLMTRIWEEKQREALYFSHHSLQRPHPSDSMGIPGRTSYMSRFSRQFSAMSTVSSGETEGDTFIGAAIPETGAGFDPTDLADALDRVGSQSPPKRVSSLRMAVLKKSSATESNGDLGSGAASPRGPAAGVANSPSLVGAPTGPGGLEPILENQVQETKPRLSQSPQQESSSPVVPRSAGGQSPVPPESPLLLTAPDSPQSAESELPVGELEGFETKTQPPVGSVSPKVEEKRQRHQSEDSDEPESPSDIRHRIMEHTTDNQAISRSASRYHGTTGVTSLANSMQIPSLATSGQSINRPDLYRSMSRLSRVSAQTYRNCAARPPFVGSGVSIGTAGGYARQESAAPSGMTVIDPQDFARPLYRADIFYTGSIHNLPEFQRAGSNMGIYRQSITSLPHRIETEIGGMFVDFEPALDDQVSSACPCVPTAARNAMTDMMDVSLLRNPLMILSALSSVVGMLGFYVPFIYLVNHGKSVGISRDVAPFLLSVIGLTNTIGRVFFGWFSDLNLVSAFTMTNITVAICGTATVICPFLESFATLAVYAAIYGFFISAYVSLTSIVLVELFGLEQLTSSFGLICMFRGLAAVASTPLAGSVVDATSRHTEAFILAGCLLLASVCISSIIYWLRRRDARKLLLLQQEEAQMGNGPQQQEGLGARLV